MTDYIVSNHRMEPTIIKGTIPTIYEKPLKGLGRCYDDVMSFKDCKQDVSRSMKKTSLKWGSLNCHKSSKKNMSKKLYL